MRENMWRTQVPMEGEPQRAQGLRAEEPEVAHRLMEKEALDAQGPREREPEETTRLKKGETLERVS